MIWKILLTAALILWAFMVFRGRLRRAREARGLSAPRPPLLPPGLLRPLAYLLLTFMLFGSAAYLVLDWRSAQETVRAQVINANTGAIVEYQIKRGSIDGRRFVTADGQEVRLADVERLIVDDR